MDALVDNDDDKWASTRTTATERRGKAMHNKFSENNKKTTNKSCTKSILEQQQRQNMGEFHTKTAGLIRT
jgi:hypothetical protein